MKLPAYPRTKPSGVEWLGDVPEHWDSLALKRRFYIVNGGTPSSSDDSYWEGEIPWFTPEDLGRIETKLISKSRRQITKDGLANCGANLSPSGSVLVSTRAPIGHVAVMGVDGCCNQGCRILEPRSSKISADFSYYVVLASNAVLNSVGKGTTFLELSAGALGAHFIPLPDPAEQRAIAAFLDRETGRIDALVAKKRELIERLKEKRSALISRTVTRGLPTTAAQAAGLPVNPPMKDSGIEWLGEIPGHWDVVPLRYAFFNLDYRRIPVAGEYRANIEKIYPYYGASGIIDYVEDYIFDETLILVAEDGANLLSRSTPLAFLATGKYWVNNHAHILKPVEGDIRYWAAVLQTYDYTPLVTGAAQPKLTSDRLGSICLPKPPPDEQHSIAAYLDAETAKLDALVAKVEEAIERLQEYRSALITAAVTGKIDVTERISDKERKQ